MLFISFITVLMLREYSGFTTVFLFLAVTIPLSWFVLKLDEHVLRKRILEIIQKRLKHMSFGGFDRELSGTEEKKVRLSPKVDLSQKEL